MIEGKLTDPGRPIRPVILKEYDALVSLTMQVGDDLIRITESKCGLARAAAWVSRNRVSRDGREWRTRQDSNL